MLALRGAAAHAMPVPPEPAPLRGDDTACSLSPSSLVLAEAISRHAAQIHCS